jgi:hypothetical protein
MDPWSAFIESYKSTVRGKIINCLLTGESEISVQICNLRECSIIVLFLVILYETYIPVLDERAY